MAARVTKEYLGDGVYVDVEHGSLKLTTEDGISATNTIWLAPEVASALVDYIKSICAQNGIQWP